MCLFVCLYVLSVFSVPACASCLCVCVNSLFLCFSFWVDVYSSVCVCACVRVCLVYVFICVFVCVECV